MVPKNHKYPELYKTVKAYKRGIINTYELLMMLTRIEPLMQYSMATFATRMADLHLNNPSSNYKFDHNGKVLEKVGE